MTVGGIIDIEGPWKHRWVAANGARFHVAEVGDGPLVVFLHGFPEFWWAWRHQLPALADVGYRAVAMDLRGYGGSDKTPRGYDPVTLSGDVAGVIRSLGETNAVVVGHGWGGYVAWATAVYHPSQVRALAVAGAPHPLRMRRAAFRDRRQFKKAGHVVSFQLPIVPERRLMADGAAMVERLLRKWAAPGSTFPDAEAAAKYKAALQLWPAPHCALEYYRWLVRATYRTDGRRFAARMKEPVRQPVLQLHGALDSSVLPTTAEGSAEYVSGNYRWRLLEGVGHFPHEEDPEAFSKELIDWLD